VEYKLYSVHDSLTIQDYMSILDVTVGMMILNVSTLGLSNYEGKN